MIRTLTSTRQYMVFIVCSILLVATSCAHPPAIPMVLPPETLATIDIHYSWMGGYSDIGGVLLTITNGQDAELQVHEQDEVKVFRATLSQERANQLLQVFSENHFFSLKTVRRWGSYVYDLGQYTVTFRMGAYKKTVYIDEKHRISQPEAFHHIITELYSLEKELGHQLDYAAFATTTVPDRQEYWTIIKVGGIVVLGVVALVLL